MTHLTCSKTGRDLRVLIVLAEALAVTDGPGGLAAGLTLIRRSLQEHWDTLHPSLDLDEPEPRTRLRFG